MELYASEPRIGVVDGKITLIIEFFGNNFRCPHFDKGRFIDFKEDFLISLKDLEDMALEQMDDADQILLTGGEPTLQKLQLINLLKTFKKYNAKNIPIVLETNASKWSAIKEVLEQDLVTKIRMLYYAPLEPQIFERATRASTFFVPITKIIEDVKKSLSLMKEFRSFKSFEVRTLIAPGIVYRVEDLLKIAPDVKDINASWHLLSFDPDKAYSKRFRAMRPVSEILLAHLARELKRAYPEIEIEVH